MNATYATTKLAGLSDTLAAATREVERLEHVLTPTHMGGYNWQPADRKRLQGELYIARVREAAALDKWEFEALKRGDVIYPEDREAIIARRVANGLFV